MLHLHVHSDYSNIRLIDSINKVSKLIQKAVNMNNSGIAITDHESVSGHVQALQIVEKGKAESSIPEDFKLILGNEIYLVNSLEEVKDNYQSGVTKFWHFILLAKDEIGHKQLRILSSLAWDNSFKTGKMERTPTLKKDLARIIKENPGHLIASTACLGGECSHWILNKNVKKFNEFVQYCYDLFGEDFYFELQPNNSEEQVLVNKTLISISEQLDIPFIVTCDAHYLNKEDRVFHEAYLNSHEEEREVGDFYATTYMMNETEIHEYLDWQIGVENVDKAIRNTEAIADKVNNYTLAHSTIVPEADVPEYQEEHYFKEFYDTHEYIRKFAYSDNKYDRYLLHLISQGFKTKGYYVGIKDTELKILIDRIEIELSEMWKVTEKIKNSISSYYISTLELIEIMWNEGDSLVGVARGSVTGMYTMYLIGLIQMNPMQWGLPHWRHISHEKAELSDLIKSAYVAIHMTKCGELRNLRCA